MKAFRKEPILRTARVVYLLTKGKKLTTTEVAVLLDISPQAAWHMMGILESSHDVPVTCINGKWQISKVTLIEA